MMASQSITRSLMQRPLHSSMASSMILGRTTVKARRSLHTCLACRQEVQPSSSSSTRSDSVPPSIPNSSGSDSKEATSKSRPTSKAPECQSKAATDGQPSMSTNAHSEAKEATAKETSTSSIPDREVKESEKVSRAVDHKIKDTNPEASSETVSRTPDPDVKASVSPTTLLSKVADIAEKESERDPTPATKSPDSPDLSTTKLANVLEHVPGEKGASSSTGDSILAKSNVGDQGPAKTRARTERSKAKSKATMTRREKTEKMKQRKERKREDRFASQSKPSAPSDSWSKDRRTNEVVRDDPPKSSAQDAWRKAVPSAAPAKASDSSERAPGAIASLYTDNPHLTAETLEDSDQVRSGVNKLFSSVMSNLSRQAADERRHESDGDRDRPPAKEEENSTNGFKQRDVRASVNAQSIEQARQSQATRGAQSKFGQVNIPPGVGTGPGPNPSYLNFESVEMVYPPRDVYPPPLPRLSEIDLSVAGRALGVLRMSDVQWIPARRSNEKGGWRPIVRDTSWQLAHKRVDRMDTEQCLEYLGDSLLHLLTRSMLINRFPRRTMYMYNLGANFLVSNDVFGHIFVDSGLIEERARIAEALQLRSKNAELERSRNFLSSEEFAERKRAAVPLISFTAIHHLRQADLFEAYVGGVYSVMGFKEASEWCNRLFEPWLDRLARTPGFDSARYFTADGEMYARMERVIRSKLAEEKELELQRQIDALPARSRWLRNALRKMFGKTVFPEPY